jgi:MraZ protein
VFQGPAALTLDGKGRIAMPARHRELLAAMGVHQLTVTKHPKARC